MSIHSTSRRSLFIALSVCLFASAIPAQAGLKIYYIRHAEGGHNVKKDWEERKVPESKWPDYVGNPDVFTPKGNTQLLAATKKLQNYTFDFIAVSPMWRARNTVLPYLKVIDGKAEIWPELHESSTSELLSPKLPKVREPVLGAGTPIEIPAEEAPYFTLLEHGKNNFQSAPREKGDKYRCAVTKLVLTKAIKDIETRFGGTDKSILLVGHGGSGKGLLKLLAKSESQREWRRSINNTGIWMVEQQKDGSYTVMMYNDVVLEAAKATKKPEPAGTR